MTSFTQDISSPEIFFLSLQRDTRSLSLPCLLFLFHDYMVTNMFSFSQLSQMDATGCVVMVGRVGGGVGNRPFAKWLSNFMGKTRDGIFAQDSLRYIHSLALRQGFVFRHAKGNEITEKQILRFIKCRMMSLLKQEEKRLKTVAAESLISLGNDSIPSTVETEATTVATETTEITEPATSEHDSTAATTVATAAQKDIPNEAEPFDFDPVEAEPVDFDPVEAADFFSLSQSAVVSDYDTDSNFDSDESNSDDSDDDYNIPLYAVGEKVLVFDGGCWYRSVVKSVHKSHGIEKYSVHFEGYNKRHDKIVNEKDVSKALRYRKIKSPPRKKRKKFEIYEEKLQAITEKSSERYAKWLDWHNTLDVFKCNKVRFDQPTAEVIVNRMETLCKLKDALRSLERAGIVAPRQDWLSCIPNKRDKNYLFHVLFVMVCTPATPDSNVIPVMKEILKKNKITPESIDKMPFSDMVKMLSPIGRQYKNTLYMKVISKILVRHFQGKVPQRLDILMSFPGVYSKIGLVVLNDGTNQIYVSSFLIVQFSSALFWYTI